MFRLEFLRSEFVFPPDVPPFHLPTNWKEYREDLRDAGTEKFMQVIVKQVEEFVQAYQEQSTATPKPTPDTMGD